MTTNLNQSIEQLENNIWAVDPHPSYLVQRCQALRKIPLAELTIEDLRMLIRQKIALPYIVPLALEQLLNNPLASGDMYEGDLLESLSKIEDGFWLSNPEINSQMLELVRTITATIQMLTKYNTLLLMKNMV